MFQEKEEKREWEINESTGESEGRLLSFSSMPIRCFQLVIVGITLA